MTIHALRCSCGHLRGELRDAKPLNRGLCYCKDCQAFAHFLDRATDVLDAQGGTDIVQTSPQAVSFSAGLESLACMRLRKTGLLRWYTTCCSTPIANTPANFKISFVGLIHSCLRANDASGVSLDAVAPTRMHVHTQSARGLPKPKSDISYAAIAGLAVMVLGARITRSYLHTPFFDVYGTPIVAPQTLGPAELGQLLEHVG